MGLRIIMNSIGRKNMIIGIVSLVGSDVVFFLVVVRCIFWFFLVMMCKVCFSGVLYCFVWISEV